MLGNRFRNGSVFALIFMLFGGILTNGYAQIDTPYPVNTMPAPYSSDIYPDTIFVFCDYPLELTASFNGNSRLYNFEWSNFNTSTLSYDVFLVENGETSTVRDLDPGGYRVRITAGEDIDTVFSVWAFGNTVHAENSIGHVSCGELALTGEVECKDLVFYHPETKEEHSIENDYFFEWTASPYAAIPYPSEDLNPVTHDPPYEDTWFYLTSEDNFGCTASDSVFYETIEVKADFVPDPIEGPAPLEVSFTNKSINAAEYQWFFGEPDGFQGVPDETSFEPVHTFKAPREYYVRLKAFSEAGCEDEFTYPDPVYVHYSKLEVPNVFTPDGDGINDVFKVDSRSLREFRGSIYNRNGKKVFEWTDPEEGWDGTVNRGKKASPGVYFYIIRGRGWDGVEYEYTGSLHLYRGG